MMSWLFNLLNEIGKALSFLIGLPKSLLINLYYLPLSQAIRLPILVSHRLKLRRIKGSITLDEIKPGIVKIGMGGMGQNSGNSESVWSVSGHIHFAGKTNMGSGVRLFIDGQLSIGEQFDASNNLLLICQDSITFGDYAMVSWNTTIMDYDGHTILQHGVPINHGKPVMIAERVWLGCNVTVCKGANIAHDTVIASGSIVTGGNYPHSTLLAGSPAKVIKEGITWQR